MSELQRNVPNEGSPHYGQSVSLPLESTLQTLRFLSVFGPSRHHPEDLSVTFEESEGSVDAWVGHHLDKIHVKKYAGDSTVEVELQEETQGAIWLDIDERDVMFGSHPQVVVGRDGQYYHRFSEKNAMRAAELVLQLANKRFADIGLTIAQDSAKNAEDAFRLKLIRERDATVHFENVLMLE
jgi:hypothetical protein